MKSTVSARLLASTLLLLPPALGCSGAGSKADVVSLVRHGHYEKALALAERNAKQAPKSKEAQDVLHQAQVAYLLDQARQTLFAGDPAQSLGLLEAAREIDPENATVATWILKVKRQLSEEWLDVANDLYALRDLDRALDAYEGALRFDPESSQAKLGISRVLLTSNYRLGQSKSYYDRGLESLRDYFLPQADNSFAKALLYDEDNERALKRKHEVEKLLVEERLGIAKELEQQGLFFAARNEYRVALLIDPDDPEAKSGYDRMDRETRARRQLDDAAMDVRRGDLEGALESLEQGQTLTGEQNDEIAELHNEIEDARLERLYQEALELERDYRFEDAIAAYDDLLAQTDGFYADAVARRQALVDFSQRAERLYSAYESAENDEERLQYLREIEVFWPEYRDVQERIGEYVARGDDLFRRAREAETPEEALALLEELAGFWPNYPGLEDWLTRLRAEAAPK